MLTFVGYRQVWSKDRNVLLQVFTNLETDLIERVTVDVRADRSSSWESLTEVIVED